MSTPCSLSESATKYYDGLRNEIFYLHVRWELFQGLFLSDEASLSTLEKYGIIFPVFSRLMLDDFVLSFVKLISKEKSCGKDQLCLAKLVNIGCPNHLRLSQQLESVHKKLKNLALKFETHRHGRVAHNNLDLKLTDLEQGTIHTGFSIKDIREFLKYLQEFMDVFSLHFKLQSPAYRNCDTENQNIAELCKMFISVLHNKSEETETARNRTPSDGENKNR